MNIHENPTKYGLILDLLKDTPKLLTFLHTHGVIPGYPLISWSS